MVRAYVCIVMVSGTSIGATRKLRSLPQIKTVDRVTGPYDIILMFEVPELNDVENFVLDCVHTIEGVERTLTCLAMGTGTEAPVGV